MWLNKEKFKRGKLRARFLFNYLRALEQLKNKRER